MAKSKSSISKVSPPRKHIAPNVLRDPVTKEISQSAEKNKYPAKRRMVKYSLSVATRICESLAVGNSLASTARKKGMPTITTIYSWYAKYPDFKSLYDQAKEDSADAHSDKLVSISEDVLRDKVNHNNARLASDNYKWLAGVHQPRKYGKQLTVNKGTDYGSQDIADLERMLIESEQRIKRVQGAVVETVPIPLDPTGTG